MSVHCTGHVPSQEEPSPPQFEQKSKTLSPPNIPAQSATHAWEKQVFSARGQARRKALRTRHINGMEVRKKRPRGSGRGPGGSSEPPEPPYLFLPGLGGSRRGPGGSSEPPEPPICCSLLSAAAAGKGPSLPSPFQP